MSIRGLVGRLALCFVLTVLSACDDAGSGTATDQMVQADPEIYGVDGYETVNGIEFVPARVMYDRYAKGEIGCWEFNFSDNTCTYTTYSTLVRPGMLDMVAFRTNPEYTIKMMYPYQVEVKGKYLCETTTEAVVQSWTANYSRDNLPKTSAGDYTVEPENLESWRDSNIRRLSKTLGIETCYRYSQVMENGVAVPGTYYAYSFIGGLIQPKRELVPVAMLAGSALEDLRMRPE